MSDRQRLARMREAAVEARAAVRALRDALAGTERELAGEREAFAAAERRGRMAAAIDDLETVSIARTFAEKHRTRVGVLERKLEAQRAELALAERDLAEMVDQVQQLEGGVDPAPSGTGEDDPLLQYRLDEAARERAADAMLRDLKKRMGK